MLSPHAPVKSPQVCEPPPEANFASLPTSHPQITLPAPKAGVRKGCAAVLAAAGGAEQQHAQAATIDTDQDSDSMDEDGEAGACAICYALHLPDPARPDELGE
jgi:hypothetical protein